MWVVAKEAFIHVIVEIHRGTSPPVPWDRLLFSPCPTLELGLANIPTALLIAVSCVRMLYPHFYSESLQHLGVALVPREVRKNPPAISVTLVGAQLEH